MDGWIDGVTVDIFPHLNTSFARIRTCVVSGWMDGWMDEWVDGWVDGWMDGWWDKVRAADGWMGG